MSKELMALDFKSANLYALRIVLREADTARLAEALNQRMTEAGSFFENEPVIIDASRLPENATLDWPALVNALRKHKLPPIGVVAESALRDAAAQAGLTPVELSTPAPRPAPTPHTHAADIPAIAAVKPEQSGQSGQPNQSSQPNRPNQPNQPTVVAVSEPVNVTPAAPAMLVTRPLRSGQRVYARGGDLVVIGMVSQGAEVIADGNIHIYGPLRGKAMAGARGDTSARIFTTQLDPELLAIAGIYHVVENKLDPSLHGRPAQIRLNNESLEIDAL